MKSNNPLSRIAFFQIALCSLILVLPLEARSYTSENLGVVNVSDTLQKSDFATYSMTQQKQQLYKLVTSRYVSEALDCIDLYRKKAVAKRSMSNLIVSFSLQAGLLSRIDRGRIFEIFGHLSQIDSISRTFSPADCSDGLLYKIAFTLELFSHSRLRQWNVWTSSFSPSSLEQFDPHNPIQWDRNRWANEVVQLLSQWAEMAQVSPRFGTYPSHTEGLEVIYCLMKPLGAYRDLPLLSQLDEDSSTVYPGDANFFYQWYRKASLPYCYTALGCLPWHSMVNILNREQKVQVFRDVKKTLDSWARQKGGSSLYSSFLEIYVAQALGLKGVQHEQSFLESRQKEIIKQYKNYPLVRLAVEHCLRKQSPDKAYEWIRLFSKAHPRQSLPQELKEFVDYLDSPVLAFGHTLQAHPLHLPLVIPLMYAQVSSYSLKLFKISLPEKTGSMQYDQKPCFTYSRNVKSKGTLPRFQMATDTVNIGHLPAGNYKLVLSGTDKQGKPTHDDEQTIVVTDRMLLSYGLRTDQPKVQMLHARTGMPIGDDYSLYTGEYTYSGEEWSLHSSGKSDSLGRLTYFDQLRYLCYKSGDAMPFIPFPWGYYRNLIVPDLRAHSSYILASLDRELYRPGQTVHFYAVPYRCGFTREAGTVLKNTPLKVRLWGKSSGQLIDSLSLTTNESGIASGSFRLPANGALGYYSIEVRLSDGEKVVQQKFFRVEEYKRPSFEVTIDPFGRKPSVGERIALTGRALTYSGSALAEAQVEYEFYGRFGQWGWWRPWGTGELQLLASGRVSVNPQTGQFEIPSVLQSLKPDYLPEDDADGEFCVERPLLPFEYHVYLWKVSVVSPGGETIFAEQSLWVGDPQVVLGYQGDNDIFLNQNPDRNVLKFSCQNDASDAPSEPRINCSLKALTGPLINRDVLWRGEFIGNRSYPLPSEWKHLPNGQYELSYRHTLPSGREVSGEPVRLTLLSTQEKELPVETPLWAAPLSNKYNERQKPILFVSSNQANQPIFYSVSWVGGDQEPVLLPYHPAHRMQRIEVGIPPLLKGGYKDYPEQGMQVTLYTVREGIVYEKSFAFTREEEPRHLTVEWSSLRTRVEGGTRQSFKARILDARGKPLSGIPVVAWMYDASLDALVPPSGDSFISRIREPYYTPRLYSTPSFAVNKLDGAQNFYVLLPHVDHSLLTNWEGYENESSRVPMSMVQVETASDKGVALAGDSEPIAEDAALLSTPNGEKKNKAGKGEIVSGQALRTQFQESAFFRPYLKSNNEGYVRWEATMPESLTRWRLILHAFTNDLRETRNTVFIETFRSLAVEPVMPRFIRRGDQASIAGSVRSLVDSLLDVTLSLELFDPRTDSVLFRAEQKLPLSPQGVQPFSFPIQAQGQRTVVGVRLLARGGGYADGEEHFLPQLPSGQLITESIPIHAVGRKEGTYNLSAYAKNYENPSLTRFSVVAQANPLLYVLQSLPALEASTGQDCISFTLRLYCRSLAQDVVRRPGVEAWLQKKRQALKTSSEKGRLRSYAYLKGMTLSQTPWESFAQTEEERSERLLALLERKDADNYNELISQLEALQSSSGHWSWFLDMPPTPTLTSHMIELLCSTLPYLPPKGEEAERVRRMLARAWVAYGGWLYERYSSEASRPYTQEDYSAAAIEYLFLWSHYIKPLTGQDAHPKFYPHALRLLRSSQGGESLPLVAMAGVAFSELGYPEEAQHTARVLRNHLTRSETTGAFFAGGDYTGYWYNPSMRLQLVALRLFDRLGDAPLVGEMKQWVVAQKRTNHWGDHLSSLRAVETLLGGKHPATLSNDYLTVSIPLSEKSDLHLTGTDIEYSLPLEELDVKRPIKLHHTEPNTPVWGGLFLRGYQSYDRIEPFGVGITIERRQYVERMVEGQKKLIPLWSETVEDKKVNTSRIRQNRATLSGITPLTENSSVPLEKGKIFSEGVRTDTAQLLRPGERIITRITFTLTQDMSFVALVDTRPGCCEPVDLLSGYQGRWWNPCYREVRDGETRFFFDHLSRGRHVIEYSQVVVRPGTYTPGVSTIQCFYAPEFVGHTGAAYPLVSHSMEE